MSELKLQPNSLLLFIDETGHEEYADDQFPIFGLGGCAVIGSSYQTLIRDPWTRMKDEFFGGAKLPLHASELRKPNENQISAIATFFSANEFSRFCAVSRSSTHIDEALIPYQATAVCLMERIRRIATQYPFDSIVMIFEASDRADMLAAKYFSNFTLTIDGTEVPIEHGRMSKSLCEPGLEVADFIMHTAGGQVNAQLTGKVDEIRKFRRDFDCVFHSVDEAKADYLLMDSIVVNRPQA